MTDTLTVEQITTGREAYRWLAQACPICEVPPTRLMGRRGGAAHRENLGVECELWRCGKCRLIFPNPMRVPVGGLAQHYRVPPEDYFQRQDTAPPGAAAPGLSPGPPAPMGRR